MSGSRALEVTCRLLAETYGELGEGAATRLRRWLSGEVPLAHEEWIARHLVDPDAAPDRARLDLLFDAFWQLLPFGTGGRRGPVGYGPNRFNPTAVAMTVQGHCRYLRQSFPDAAELRVVVANDVRVFRDVAGTYRFLGDDHPLLGVSSRSLAELACEIYAGNGVVAYFAEPERRWDPDDERPPAVLATPELSYVIGELEAHGGINLSASHNPPDDNGIKVYDHYGSQPVAPQDQHLVDAMEGVGEPRRLAYDEARARGLLRAVPAELHGGYVRTYVDLYGGVHRPDPELPVTYTPLCGCGLSTVGDVLRELGFPLRVPPAEGPDGTFAVIPFRAPNPEVPQSTAPARAFADGENSGVVLSSDPDADRVGVEVRLEDGWYHLDGNQIAAILTYYLMLDPQGPRRRGLVIETLVTTKILGAIVERAGDSWLIDDLLVGFKYVADVLKTLAETGRWGEVRCAPEDLVLATEESHGVVMVPSIRDKDSTPACMYFAALYQRLRREGRTLLDYYVSILEELGGYDTVNRSIMMAGASGMARKDAITRSLRESPPETLGGERVREIVDYWDEDAFGPFKSPTDRLPRNVLQLHTESFIITVRPSGTEPKLKLYCQLLPSGEPLEARGRALLDEVRARADAVARRVYHELLARIDLEVSEAALLLPDLVDLERKQRFDAATVPALRAALADGGFADLDAALAWLRTEAAAMTPGSDPLPALRAPLAHLLRSWAEEGLAGPVVDALDRWARG